MKRENMSLYSMLLIVVFIAAVFTTTPIQPVSAALSPLSVKSVKSTSLAYGQEGRYTIEIQSTEAINIGSGTKFSVNFPNNSSLIKNDILAENPGCTLSNVRYKKGDTNYVLQGTVDITDNSTNTLFNMTVGQQTDTIPVGTSVYLSIPGVVNKTAGSGGGSGGGGGGGTANNITVSLQQSVGGEVYTSAEYNATIGNPPTSAPTGLTLDVLGSSKVSAFWNTVSGAAYYQLYFSGQADGTYIQASDFSNNKRDPDPGEQESLTITTTTFSGGNSGLYGDRTYYFKVRAGNQYGYGPLSDAVAVKTLAVKPSSQSPAAGATQVALNAPISVTLNQDVAIKNAHYIQVFEKATGIPVTITERSASGNTVNIKAELKANTSYQAVFYYQALKSSANSLVWNENFDWSFTTGGGN